MDYVDKVKIENTSYKMQDSEAARSVDGTKSHVEEANQIHTTTGVTQTSDFIFRTTAGDASISSGSATLMAIYGNTEQTGHTDESLTATGSFANEGTTVAIDAATWKSQVAEDGTYVFSYDGTNWKLNDATVSLATYGLTVTGAVANGDSISVSYTKLVIGTLSTAKPASFVSTGFNQYNAIAGYAHVKGENQYRIDGTYTSLGFTTTVGGTTEAVTVEDGKFTPAEDGYIYVTGGSGDILIALVWSGIRDSDPYEVYSETTVTIPTADASSTALPTASYGMPSVGDVKDEVSFIDRQYIKRIGHYSYSEANLATVEALGVDYVYDLNDIFYVLATPVVYTLASTVSGSYAANDFGTEEFTGTSEALEAVIYYGNNLVDKLRNLLDIQSIGEGLTLTGSELSASGEGGVKTLTTADYNYPTNNPTSVALWLLPIGLYKISAGLPYYRNGSNLRTPSRDILCVIQPYSSNIKSIFLYNDEIPSIYRTNMGGGRITTGYSVFGSDEFVLTGQSVLDKLTSSSAGNPLSANQGRVLNEKIGTLSSLTTTAKTSTVAAINELVARVAALEGN